MNNDPPAGNGAGGPTTNTAKEGQTMNVELWIQLIAVVLRIFAAGMAG